MPDLEIATIVARALDQLTDFASVLDRDGTVIYINPFGHELLGYEPDQLTGKSIVDLVHPDDLERAFIAIDHVVSEEHAIPVTPAFYRLKQADGQWCRVEFNATLIGTPEHPDRPDHIVLIGRYSGDHDLQDRLLELLTGNATLEAAIALVPEFGDWRHEGVDYGVFVLDDEGQPIYAGSELIASLGGPDDPRTPWAEVAASGIDQLVELDEETSEYAKRARAHGITHVWGLAVPDPLHDTYAVITFVRREPDMAPLGHGYVLDIMARALQLILQWRHQVVSLRRSARSDPLTGLANRTRFREVLDGLHAEAEREVLGVLYVDLDGFKPINDAHGHHVGDVVLAEVARRLTHVMRPGDVVARLGGDEFAIVAHHLGGDGAAEAIADRVVSALSRPFTVAGRELRLGASVGIAMAPADDFDPDRLLRQADRALYRAKDEGRGIWRMADPDA